MVVSSHWQTARRVAKRAGLLRILPRDSVGAECGVFRGHFSRILWRIVRPRRLYLVDVWDPRVPVEWVELREVWRHRRKVKEWHRVVGSADSARRDVVAWARGRRGRRARAVVPVWHDSVAWLRDQPAASLDWVYLDSDHSFEHVSRELEAAARAVRPGGWLLGHDWCQCLPGVALAVAEFCQATGRRVDYLTNEPALPVWPRAAWMPAQDHYQTWAVRV